MILLDINYQCFTTCYFVKYQSNHKKSCQSVVVRFYDPYKLSFNQLPDICNLDDLDLIDLSLLSIKNIRHYIHYFYGIGEELYQDLDRSYMLKNRSSRKLSENCFYQSKIYLVLPLYIDLVKANISALKSSNLSDEIYNHDFFSIYDLQLKNVQSLLGNVLRLAPIFIFKEDKVINKIFTDLDLSIEISDNIEQKNDQDDQEFNRQLVSYYKKMFFNQKLIIHLRPYQYKVFFLTARVEIEFVLAIKCAFKSQTLWIIDDHCFFGNKHRKLLRSIGVKFHAPPNSKRIDLVGLYLRYLDVCDISPYYH